MLTHSSISFLKLLFEIEKEYNISNYILDPEKMIKLDDMFIWRYNMTQGSFDNSLINNIFPLCKSPCVTPCSKVVTNPNFKIDKLIEEEKKIAPEKVNYFIIFKDSNLVSCVRLIYKNNSKSCYLNMIHTNKYYRNQGICKKR